MGSSRLDAVAQTRLVDDGSGNGTGSGGVSFSVPWGQTWRISGVAVSTDQGDQQPFPECRVYRGTPSPANLIASTYSGQNDTASGGEVLYAGELLTIVWTVGLIGSLATAHVTGEVEAAGGF